MFRASAPNSDPYGGTEPRISLFCIPIGGAWQAFGFPLVGDPLYGVGGVPKDDIPLVESGFCGRSDESTDRSTPLPRDCGYHLHAHTVEMNHPVTGEEMKVEAPIPPMLCADSPWLCDE